MTLLFQILLYSYSYFGKIRLIIQIPFDQLSSKLSTLTSNVHLDVSEGEHFL